ncbi:efflux transporter outer membrane subunit [Flavobacterium subsaxonicum]|uniref:RND transporter n=1 Tax=Flavobacterium subsaxonicum WB 4.1-42 = DSM 21790 TaxID=1121898 RepID=A0A0A2MMT6_9FLAO|nr:efflux transporter outer membrane subunit [Flavobacterium subsaxonicum]KGO92886.1 RND transporter [Flavobacterium subsaxonicum WB 4.1-42 = DSM 21790]
MKTFNIYILFAAMLVIAGCSVSKDTKTPEPELPTAFRNNDVTVTDTTSIADIEWKSFFPDANLQELIGRAIAKNYDMQTAIKNLEIAQLQFRQSKWGNVPQLNASVTASTTIASKNSLNGISLNSFLNTSHIEDYSAGGTLSWEADIWGKIGSRKREALAAYLKTEEARKAIQTDIVASVAQGYYNLLMLDAQLDIAIKNRDLGENTVKIIKQQFTAGQVTSLATEQADAQRLVAAQIVPQLEKEIAIQENALSVLAGSLPDAIARDTKLDLAELHTQIATGLPAGIVSRRPDVRSFEYELNAANARVGIAKAYMYPALNITAGGGVNSFQSNNWFNMPASLFGMVAGSLTQPLLQGRRLKTQYEVAKTEREKAVIAFRQSVLVAVGEVSDALVEVEKLKEERAFATARVDNLQRAVTNADMLFKSGMATYLEVITAQSNVLQSELELAALKRNQLSAVARLYKALGGGWK